MQDPDAGIPTVNTRVDDVDYSHCFSGETPEKIISWLLRNRYNSDSLSLYAKFFFYYREESTVCSKNLPVEQMK